jgi:hypothetical protein
LHLRSVPDWAKTHPAKGAELRELRGSQAQAARMQQRATTAGNSRDLVVLMGDGLGGAGAVGGGNALSVGPGHVTVSVPFTLFSSGPTAEQRKKNEKIDAEYQLRLRALDDRVLLKRDSLRADSLRRDSLANKKRSVPNF